MKCTQQFISNRNIIFFVTIIIVIGQIFVISNSNIYIFMALGMSAVVASILPLNQLIPFMLCLIAPNRVLTYGIISAPTIVMLVGIIRQANCIIKMKKNLFLASFLLLEFSVIISFLGEIQFFDAIKIIIVILFLTAYTEKESIEKVYVSYVKFCTLGCILSTLIALIMNPSSISENSRFSLSGVGENALGILSAILAINLMVIFMNGYEQNNLIIVLFIISLCVIGFLTGSRSFMLAILVGVVGIIVCLILKLQIVTLFKIGVFFILAVIIAIVLVNTNDFINEYWKQIVYRIMKLQNQDISNGRYALWEQYINVFKEHPIYLWLGGLNTNMYGIHLVAHNMILEQLACFGIIGSVFIIFIYCSAYMNLKRESSSYIKWKSYRIVPIISLLIVSLVSHTLLGVPQTVMLYLSALALLKQE